MSTDQAFIKAFRHDAPRAPHDTGKLAARSAATTVAAAPWLTSVEIVTAGFVSTLAAPVVTHTHTSATDGPIIGKRPLSSFTAEPPNVPRSHERPAAAEPNFVPETLISGFRWPRICRSLWERHSEDYERVVDQLLTRCQREPGRGGILGVCGLADGDGCTTSALCLAVAMAARRVGDRRRGWELSAAPRLAEMLGVEPATTWCDVLEKGLSVAEAVVRSERDHIDLLPLVGHSSKSARANSAELAASLQTAITAGVLRYAYDAVLVDLGAILAPRAFPTIQSLVSNMRIDAAVAIASAKQTSLDDLAVAGELLDETNCELLGVIENRV